MQPKANVSLPSFPDEAQPQNLAVAQSLVHTIGDRSAKQPTLQYKKPDRPFVSRCFEVNLPCAQKMVYIALAHRCKVWTDGNEGETKQLGRSRIAADAGLSLRKFKLQIASLVSDELVSVKRTGRTNTYIVRIPAEALALANTQPETADPEPWKAAGVSRRTWYRDRARTEPKTTHGGARLSPTLTRSESGSSGTDGPTGGPSDGPTGGPSIEGVFEGVRTYVQSGGVRTQLSKGPTTTAAPRTSCPDCDNTWPAEFGDTCHVCSNEKHRTTGARTTGFEWQGRIQNCPQCHAIERGHDDTCQHCDWTREAWEARATDGKCSLEGS